MKNKMTKADRKKLHNVGRRLVQLIFFILMPSAFTSAFSGVKYIITQIGAGNPVEVTGFIKALLVLVIFTVIFGRYFCGFACAFGSLGDFLHGLYIWCCKKCKKKPLSIPENCRQKLDCIKYLVLAAILLLCYMEIYGGLKGWNPWEVFSILRSGKLVGIGYLTGTVLLLLICIGMVVCERFFCRFLCPMGAVFSLLPVIPLFSLHRNRQECYKGCSSCERNCPADVKLPDSGSWEQDGACFMCQKCMEACPKENVTSGVFPWKGNGIVFMLIRAALLFTLLFLAGV